jgi:hypothetical protein
VNLWRIIKTQAALALFVAAAMTQVAHAGTMPSQKALDALGARWNAVAESYGARPASSYYTKQALDAMGQRSQAQIRFDPGVLFPNADPSSPGYVPGAEQYEAFRTDFPSAPPEQGPASTGYVVGGTLIQPGQSVAEARSSVRPDDRAGIRSSDGLAVSNADGSLWGTAAAEVLANEPGVSTQILHEALGTHAASDRPQGVRPDDRSGVRGPEAQRAAGTTADAGFHWGDAGIGAGALAICLLAGSMLIAFNHRRRKLAVL